MTIDERVTRRAWIGRAEQRRLYFVRGEAGRDWSSNATAPAVIAERRRSLTRRSSDPTDRECGRMLCRDRRARDRELMTERPEATRSGLKMPSKIVGPTLEKQGTDSLAEARRARGRRHAPTVGKRPDGDTSGSSPGEVIVPLSGP